MTQWEFFLPNSIYHFFLLLRQDIYALTIAHVSLEDYENHRGLS